ncbi:ATP-grasp domain-containing protein [Paenibacillus sp. OV219]|uniref:ATP-grasp domain-containing protein n=1 Tax=Paenibacillus sp. OV219 TaxID=1884377 RepID=UPI0008C94545|nr:ATP-grasp domain-containing protein [Paenibacillus sp. OV219]SEN65419.1 carbamoyl-phosphate synthase large subunit [Paenibacillus sp. OV219]
MRTILFTSIGRRVQLVRHFIENGWDVIGADADPSESASSHFVRNVYKVPLFREPGYFEALRELCIREKVSVLVPLYEPELIGMAQRKESFREIGVQVLVSDEAALARCLDKYELAQFLTSNGIATPATYPDLSRVDSESKWVVKPRTGMGSKDVYIADAQDAASCYNKVKDAIVQRFVRGQEYSIDAFVNEHGQILSIVPRKRLDVRAGEVAKSVTVVDDELTRLTAELLSHLQLIGPLTIQGIKEASTGMFFFIEVNPRFGGGVPLTIQSGIPYSHFIAGHYPSETVGLHPYQGGLKMLRYDEAVFVTE